MSRSEPLVLLALLAIAVAASLVRPFDPVVWLLEAVPVLIAVPVLLLTARRFPLTPLAYRLIFLHALILVVGAHYSYARVPAGFWVRDWLGLVRNNWDRLGHLAQGFVPAIIAREILLRRGVLRPGGWLFFLVACVCLALSACYEFIEWATAVSGGYAAEEFLATQGDPWDTQWDMFSALLGALAAQLLLARRHDAALAQLAAAGARGFVGPSSR